MKIFNQISASDFFENYWQKKPLVIKNAIPDFKSPLDADELAGLATEPDIESRLIMEKGGKKPWEVISGPLTEETLTKLPESNWSLSAQGVDRIVPEVSSLLSYFKFLPNWLLDDIMVSYAPENGSVGAHIDNYDVFIIQAQGKRLWQLGGKPEHDEEYQEDLDIRLLKNFNPEHEWELTSGDVLYIPTRFSHHGVAVGECLNYSVGFRAPTDAELVRSFSGWAAQKELADNFFRESNLSVQESPREITEKSLNQLADHMKAFIDSPNFKEWFGEHISEPKSFYSQFEHENLSKEELAQRLKSGEVLVPAEGLKRCWINSAEPMLFMEGERIEVPQGLGADVFRLLCDADEVILDKVPSYESSSTKFFELLALVFNKGFFVLRKNFQSD